MREMNRVDVDMGLTDSIKARIGLIGDVRNVITIFVVCVLKLEEDNFVCFFLNKIVSVYTTLHLLTIQGTAKDSTSLCGGIRIGSVLYCA